MWGNKWQNKLFLLDEESLDYKKINLSRTIIIFLLTSITIFLTLIIFSFSYYKKYQKLKCEYEEISSLYDEECVKSKYDINPIKNQLWLDSVFSDYSNKANLYLSRPIWEGTPLSGDMLSLCARNAYDSTGILLPVELALTQAQHESSMGREGRSPKNNPFNIGEYDSGTVMWFSSTFDGVQKYYYTMCNDYLRCHTTEQLLFNFVNCAGSRYAKPGYEENISPTYRYIKKWLKNNE